MSDRIAVQEETLEALLAKWDKTERAVQRMLVSHPAAMADAARNLDETSRAMREAFTALSREMVAAARAERDDPGTPAP